MFMEKMIFSGLLFKYFPSGDIKPLSKISMINASGQQGAYLPSEVRWRVSLTCQLSIMSHSLMVLSQEALARTDWTGLKHRELTGPSWPPRT